jgi:RNA polymerase-binding transcription factor DksA
VEDDLDGPDFDGPDLIGSACNGSAVDGLEADGPEAEGHGELVDTAPDNVATVLAGRSPGGDGSDEDIDQQPTAELDIDGSLLDTIEEELADVERALALLDEGGYGRCEACGGTIDDDVLTRTPTARFCAEHLPLTLR